MTEQDGTLYPCLIPEYAIVAISQLTLIPIAWDILAPVRNGHKCLDGLYKEALIHICGMAVVLLIAQLYMSAIIASHGGPWFINPWLAFAQVVVSQCISYLLHEYFESDEYWPTEDDDFTDEENTVSTEEGEGEDDDFTDEENTESTEQGEADLQQHQSSLQPNWQEHERLTQTGSFIAQLSGPGGASPVSV